LIGLNEISNQFLPVLFHTLELFGSLTQARASIHQMRTYLLQHQQTIHAMTPEQRMAYEAEEAKIQGISLLIADTMQCLEKFCRSMPLEWMVNPNHDFCAAFFHLMREPTCNINVIAVECLDQLAVRGKLSYEQWIHWIQDLPQAVQQASQQLDIQEQEYIQVQLAVTSNNGTIDPSSLPDKLARQLDYHRALSKMLSTILSSHMSNIHQYKHLLQPPSNDTDDGGNKAILFANYLRLLVEMLRHPSGRVGGEQVNLWIMMLKDPQISKATSKVLDPLLGDILSCFMIHMVRLNWDDVLENDNYPNGELIQASWEDEEEYDAWVCEFRSKSSQLFKYIGNCRPHIATSVLKTRMEQLISQHGDGQPLNHLYDNRQLSQSSTAVREFEGFSHPMDNVLSGMPSWVFENSGGNDPGSRAAQSRSSIASLAQMIVAWNPSYVWLKFRKTQLLEGLRHFWKYDSSFLLEGVDSLLKTIGAPDEMGANSNNLDGSKRMSDDTTSLRKRSSTALVAVSKLVPDKLVPWLSQLSEATRALLSSDDLLSTNRMHLYEFLSVVATAVDNPSDRSNFVGSVLADAINTIQSLEIQQALSSVDSFLNYLGIAQASSNPSSVTDEANVKLVTGRFVRFFSAFNELLSVGRRCHEASKNRPSGGIPSPGGSNVQIPTEMSVADAAQTLSFPDEGPVSIRDLSVDDPFVPLWPSILPSLLRIVSILFEIWRPRWQAVLLRDPIQRYVLSISDDDAYLCRKSDGKTGGVFGEGGTAGSIIPDTDRRDQNLAPRWSSWFNELRNSLLQLLGLMAGQRVLYSHETAEHFPQVVAVVADPENLQAMENRHMAQYLKQFIEIVMLSCPTQLYPTHLAPILDPVLHHIRYRLEKTWEPVLRPRQNIPSCAPVSADSALAAASLAAQGGEAWYLPYYARSGLFVGSLDATTAEAAVDKFRIEVTRVYSDMLQSSLALKGPWALVLANITKEEESSKGNDKGPPGKLNLNGGRVNADGTPRALNQKSLDARRLQRIAALDHFLFLENESIAGNITLSIVQCFEYPDTYTCRRLTRVSHRLLETVAWQPRYTELLGRRLLSAAVRNIVTEPKWMVGVEWETINVIRDIYNRLSLGMFLQYGGQGAAQQQPTVATAPVLVYEQTKTVDRPLQGGGILTTPSDLPREVLAALPGITVDMIRQLDVELKEKRSAKAQKDIIKDFLIVAADQMKENDPNSRNSLSVGILDRSEGSLSHLGTRGIVDVEDIPEKLVTASQLYGGRKNKEKSRHNAEIGLGAFNLFN
jgi:Exportin-5 family